MNEITYIPRNVLYYEPFQALDIESRWDKKHSMPFIIGPAVGFAAAAVGVAAAGATLATVASAALAVVGAIGAIATVAGLAMTVVGAITGDKSLMKIGGIVGLAGGIAGLGSLALSSGLSMVSTEFAAASAAATTAQTAAGATSGLSGITNAVDAGKAGASIGESLPANIANQAGGVSTSAADAAFTGTAKSLTADIKAADLANSALANAPTSSIGSGVTDAAKAAETAKNPGFWDSLSKPATNGSNMFTGVANIAGSGLTAMASQSNTDAQRKTAAEAAQYAIAQNARAYANANDLTHQLSFQTAAIAPVVAPLTPGMLTAPSVAPVVPGQPVALLKPV